MPFECTELRGEDEKFTACPKCGHEPFESFIRGAVQRSPLEAPVAWLKSWWYCAVICSECKDIVGYEAPPLPRCRTHAWCPKCDRNLPRHGYLESDEMGGPVVYRCSKCGHRSFWDFDAPAPIRLPPYSQIAR